MATFTPKSSRPALPEQLQRRLESLEIAVIRVQMNEGAQRVHLEGSSRWIDRLILDSSLFEKTLSANWKQLVDPSAQPVQLWPGLTLAPLRSDGRRRSDQNHEFAAVILSGELLTCEQLHHVCDEHEIDYAAVIDRISPELILAESDVQRLAMLLGWMHADAETASRQQSELHGLSRELADSYEELSLLYKLSTNMTLDQPPAHFLIEACDELQEVLGLRWMALHLIDNDPRLDDLAGKMFVSGNADGLENLRAIGQFALDDSATPDAPQIIDNPSSLGIEGLGTFTNDLLIVRLMSEDGVLGVLFGGDKLDGEKLSSIDAKLCSALAGSLSIFIENTMLYDDMQDMFMGVLQALTVAIDAKDSYTHGHSERVALMSRLLAEAVGLDKSMVERVYLSGLVHDVGKIGVPESVLCKPSRLTLEEFEQIKLHPEIGARIIADIRQMQDLVPGVMHHHERWDGKGYPHGLAGDQIPFFGRLICLADAFDAMSSDRTYRKSRTHEEVIAEIRQCAGTQFDPELAKRFVELDFEPFFELIKKHRSEASQKSA